MAQNEAVDQCLSDAGVTRFVSAIDQAQRRSGRIAGNRNAKHQFSPVWASDHVGNGIRPWRQEADGIELAVTQHSSPGVGAVVTKLAGRSLDALVHIGPHKVWMVEYIRNSAAGDPGDPADISEGWHFGSTHFLQLDNFLERSKFFLDSAHQKSEFIFGALQNSK
ncbi:hypothetical protein MESS2_790046 [Mesorhizobium metallidurans STM 2683]|uniref:Uncharacterized protein n=1 Tax=Mesorhizobium metallidurans STM 2683 TaxID=1297569 RepID=M5EUT6_9HYPH|nr:hypothetical protein MESS2_790046 [Mesorhizobium metallidurans STM 2683]